MAIASLFLRVMGVDVATDCVTLTMVLLHLLLGGSPG